MVNIKEMSARERRHIMGRNILRTCFAAKLSIVRIMLILNNNHMLDTFQSKLTGEQSQCILPSQARLHHHLTLVYTVLY